MKRAGSKTTRREKSCWLGPVVGKTLQGAREFGDGRETYQKRGETLQPAPPAEYRRAQVIPDAGN